MVTRLVLGTDIDGIGLIEELGTYRGDLFVLDPDAGRVEQLRNRNVAAVQGSVTDVETLRKLDVTPDVILVLGNEPSQNIEAATVAKQVFESAYMMATTGLDATAADRAELQRVADDVISAGKLLVNHIESIIGDETVAQLHGLRETLRSIDGPLGVFTHDNPDPDAIASAVALVDIAERFDVEATPCYYGEITHQENRAFVNLLEFELENVDSEDELPFAHYALVDHSGPGINDQLPSETPIDIVLDHHSPTGNVEGDFVDVRPSVGATSTMLVDYLEGFDIGISAEIATGLLYGIRTDTRDFVRHVTVTDFEAAAYLHPSAEPEILHRIESPSVSPQTISIIARAIQNRQVRGRVLTSCVGNISDRDAIAQAADRLLNLEHINVVFVFGYREGRILLSGRARGVKINLGEVLRSAFGDMGSAGGHENMAGAQIPMGIFDEIPPEEESGFAEIVEGIVTGRIYDVLNPTAIEA